jgi:hypothetical protein
MTTSRSEWSHRLDPVAITTAAVAEKRHPALRVFHDEGPGGWQFYDDVEPLEAPVVVPKEELLALDPSLAEITDLPVGWEAVREDGSSPWVRAEVE